MTVLNNNRWLIIFVVFLIGFLSVWQLATMGYEGQSMPGPLTVARSSWEFLSDPFYDNGPNDKGIGTLTLYSLGRLVLGFCAGTLVAIFLGVILGLNQTLYKGLNPFIQILKAISPIAWMPLLLYSVQDSGITALLVVFMASIWPTLANTAFGVANIRRDYLNVSNILQMSWPTRLFKVILPAAAPTIVAGLRISIGSSWVAIVPAEALLGSLGLGYFIWNEWNNLSISNVIFAILVIGSVGVFLDVLFNQVAKKMAYSE